MDLKSVCFSSGPIFLYFCLLWLHCPTILKRLERPPDDKVPDDALVNLLKLLQDGVPVVLHLLGLVLVELNEGVGLAADDLQTGIENTGF